MTAHPQLIDLLDTAKARAGFTSDRQLGDAVGDSPQVSRWRKGFTLPGKDTAVALAELAGRDPREVLDLIGLLEAQRSNQTRAAAIYREALRRVGAASICVTLLLIGGRSPEAALNPINRAYLSVQNAADVYIMRQIRRLFRRWARGFGGLAHA